MGSASPTAGLQQHGEGFGSASRASKARKEKERARLDARKNGRIAGSGVVRDPLKRRSIAQTAYGFPGTPPSAIVHAVPEFIWGMSV
jgi:hypothetical protein